MRKWSRYVAGVIAVTGVLALVTYAGAETCKLEAKRVDTVVRCRIRTDAGRILVSIHAFPVFLYADWWTARDDSRSRASRDCRNSRKSSRRSRAAYNSEHPFRGVAKLGSQYYGFVSDTATKKDDQGRRTKQNPIRMPRQLPRHCGSLSGARKVMKTVAYERLYFDINHNGDLTDDEVIEAKPAGNMSTNYVSCVFPDRPGYRSGWNVEIEYAFTMNVYSNADFRLLLRQRVAQRGCLPRWRDGDRRQKTSRRDCRLQQ